MVVHLGGGCMVLANLIVGIFDLDQATRSAPDTADFLRSAEEASRLHAVNPELPETFVVMLDQTVYLTSLPAETIRERLRTGLPDALSHAPLLLPNN